MGRKAGGLLLLIAVAGVLWWAVAHGPLRDPEETLQDFYASAGRSEAQLTDPLLLNARRVEPLVVDAVADPGMKNRRAALQFLACEHSLSALQTFREILADGDEPDHLRGEALQGLWLVRPAEGREIASGLVEDQSFVGVVARGILSGTWDPVCREWWDAVRGAG